MLDTERMMPSARMIRAARALLNLEQAELGELVGVWIEGRSSAWKRTKSNL